MRVLYQPTLGTPGDWAECQCVDWGRQGAFDCMALNVQGLVFEGADHYDVLSLGNDVVEIAAWHDDPTDWPVGTRWARVVTISPLRPDPRPEYGGALNTNITTKLYVEDTALFEAAYKGVYNVQVFKWSSFRKSKYTTSRSGLWVTDQQYADHQAARAVCGWREWTEGLDASELDANGFVKQQRLQGRYVVPKGTRTYYHNATDAATGVHNAGEENELGNSPAGLTNETVAVNQNGTIAFTGTTIAGEPDSAAWPTTGVYRCQIDAAAVGADHTFGLLTINGNTGHFSRVDSGLTSDQETFDQAQAAFNISGLHLATVTDPSWSAGSIADRFEIAIAVNRNAGHGPQDFTLQLGELDDFADGPWVAAPAGPAQNAIFFGMGF